jgi:hypothetical protein
VVRLEALEASLPAAEQAACAAKTIAHARHVVCSIFKERVGGMSRYRIKPRWWTKVSIGRKILSAKVGTRVEAEMAEGRWLVETAVRATAIG